MDKIFLYFKGEWEVISKAPFSFLIFGSLVFGVGYAISSFLFKNNITNKEATIQLLNATVQSIEERANLEKAKLKTVMNDFRDENISLGLKIRTLEIENETLKQKKQENKRKEVDDLNGEKGNGKKQ